jgi:drug/metabolite transporter (DMT)-like permease
MKAIGLAVLGFFCFTLMDLSIKWLLQSHSLMQVTFFNSLFAVIGLLIWIYPNFSVLKTRHPRIHLLRALIVLVVDLLAFYSYGEVALAEAYTLILTMPLFTVVFSIILGYEDASFKRILLSFVGFGGILLVLSPGFGSLEIAMLAALASAVIEAVGFLIVTHNKNKEPPQVFAFYGMALLVLVSGVLSISGYQPMTAEHWLVSIAGGVCYALASALVVSAFHCGQPGAVSSIQYSQLLWGMLLGLLIWGDIPTTEAMIGGGVIVVAGLLLMFSKSKPDEKNTPVVPESLPEADASI